MPPKKAPSKGKQGKKKKGTEPEVEPVEPPSEKELLMKAELESLVKELDESRARILKLRAENEWLQEEANKIRVENHEYMSYVEKKTAKRQMTIISLSDYNKKQIDDLRIEEQEVTAEFEKKKDELMTLLLEKESILAKTNRELDELQDFKTVQQNHLRRIRELEREIMSLRIRHSDKIQELKAAFLREKQECQINAEKKIADMSKQASQEAMLCLDIHGQRVRSENRSLRHELLALIRKSQALREHERHLLEQQQTLRNERQYAEDIGRLSAERKLRSVPAICAEATKTSFDAGEFGK